MSGAPLIVSRNGVFAAFRDLLTAEGVLLLGALVGCFARWLIGAVSLCSSEPIELAAPVFRAESEAVLVECHCVDGGGP